MTKQLVTSTDTIEDTEVHQNHQQKGHAVQYEVKFCKYIQYPVYISAIQVNSYLYTGTRNFILCGIGRELQTEKLAPAQPAIHSMLCRPTRTRLKDIHPLTSATLKCCRPLWGTQGLGLSNFWGVFIRSNDVTR